MADTPVVIEATDSNQVPPNAIVSTIPFGLDLVVFNYDLLPIQCPDSESAAVTDATDNPKAGALLTFEQLQEGASGSFDIQQTFTPGGPGKLLICAYSEYVNDDAAWASTLVTVAPASGGTTPPPTSSTPTPTTTTPTTTTPTPTTTTPTPTATTPTPDPSSGAKPKVVKRPRITRHGRRATCTRGAWSGRPTAYAYRWRIDGAHGPLGRAVGRSATLTLSGALRKDAVVCTVTAKNKAGSLSANTAPLRAS